MGGFNRLDTLSFRNAFKLKQIVKFHTRGDQTLDLVLTNIKEKLRGANKTASVWSVRSRIC